MKDRTSIATGALAAALLLATAPAPADAATGRACVVGPGPEYYSIDLVPTGNVPGTRRSRGVAEVAFPSSPFGVSVEPDGSYVYDLSVRFEELKTHRPGVFTVWVTTTNLDQVRRLGTVDDAGLLEGRVSWNKFLVVVTLEESDDPEQEMWKGPIVSRGLSRSGLLHTMAGHGPFQQENCASYGFGG